MLDQLWGGLRTLHTSPMTDTVLPTTDALVGHLRIDSRIRHNIDYIYQNCLRKRYAAFVANYKILSPSTIFESIVGPPTLSFCFILYLILGSDCYHQLIDSIVIISCDDSVCVILSSLFSGKHNKCLHLHIIAFTLHPINAIKMHMLMSNASVICYAFSIATILLEGDCSHQQFPLYLHWGCDSNG